MDSVRELVERMQPGFKVHEFGRVYRDTSEFMDIGPGDVIAVGDRHYLVSRDAVERGFGYKDTKFWVKRCRELESGESKILKLVFHENFNISIGSMKVRCYRSPTKEARMLDLVRGDTRFMQGRTVPDTAGNPVRIIDVILGKRIDFVTAAIKGDHEEYFHAHLPSILAKFIAACEGIGFLHDNAERHGDISLDHLMKEYDTGLYRWIDFDYAYEAHANPWALDLFGLGRMLACLVGKYLYTPPTLTDLGVPSSVAATLDKGDFSCVYHNEVMNLRKLYPYIPTGLNNVLMHFSESAEVCYDSVPEFLDELRESLSW